MIINPSNPIKSTNTQLQDRKFSLHKHKTINTYQLQLPRFYSSDQKQKNNQVAFNSKGLLSKNNLNFYSHSKKETHLATKNQYNNTPSKQKDVSSKNIRRLQQKGDQFLQNRHNQTKINMNNKGKLKLDSQRLKTKMQIITTATKQSQSGNKIRYKPIQKRFQDIGDRQTSHKLQAFDQAEMQLHNAAIKKKHKHLTEQISSNVLKERNSILIDKFDQYLREFQIEKKIKYATDTRTMSTFEKDPQNIVGKLEKDHLKAISNLIKSTITHINNLDYSQTYIVNPKQKFQNIIFLALGQNLKKQYIMNLSYTRFTYYLCAHLILLSINAKILIPIFNRLLQSQQSLLQNLMSNQHTQRSLKKALSNSLLKRTVASNKGSKKQVKIDNNFFKVIHRNNQIIKKSLQRILQNQQLPFCQLFKELIHYSETIENIEYIGFLDKTLKWQILKMPTSPFLPKLRDSNKHNLILDLDETLIHYDQQTCHVRPHVQFFLDSASEYYEITIFTAATKQYADQIIDQIDRKKHIKHRLYRNHLTFLNGQSIKDLTMLGRDMKNTIIVDNLQNNFRLNPQNGIAIKSWYGSDNDAILKKLETLLKKIAVEFSEDLRKGLKLYRSFIDKQITQNQSYSRKKG